MQHFLTILSQKKCAKVRSHIARPKKGRTHAHPAHFPEWISHAHVRPLIARVRARTHLRNSYLEKFKSFFRHRKLTQKVINFQFMTTFTRKLNFSTLILLRKCLFIRCLKEKKRTKLESDTVLLLLTTPTIMMTSLMLPTRDIVVKGSGGGVHLTEEILKVS